MGPENVEGDTSNVSLQQIDAKLEQIDAKLEQIDAELKEHGKKLEQIDERLQNHGKEIRKLSYKIDDLEFRFKMHEKSHELSEEGNLDDLYEEPTPALGGIAGEISPTGRFMRW